MISNFSFGRLPQVEQKREEKSNLSVAQCTLHPALCARHDICQKVLWPQFLGQKITPLATPKRRKKFPKILKSELNTWEVRWEYWPSNWFDDRNYLRHHLWPLESGFLTRDSEKSAHDIIFTFRIFYHQIMHWKNTLSKSLENFLLVRSYGLKL